MESLEDPWERHAGWWQKEFTQGADLEYREQILPITAELMEDCVKILDVGCGEGQISRHLKKSNRFVVGIDRSQKQIEKAIQRKSGPKYLRANARLLPFQENSFDGVLVSLVWEHITEIDRAISEIARVLVAGGRFVLFINHPLLQTPGSGWIDDQILDPPEKYWRIGPYIKESLQHEEIRPGIFLPFVHRPLSEYINKMAAVGLTLNQMLEPTPPSGLFGDGEKFYGAETIPRLMVLLCTQEK